MSDIEVLTLILGDGRIMIGHNNGSVLLSRVEKAREPGASEKVGESELSPILQITTTDPRSFDSLINQLKLARDLMIENKKPLDQDEEGEG